MKINYLNYLIKMFIDLLKENIKSNTITSEKNKRFRGIYEPDDSSDSDSESITKVGQKALSSSEKNKIIKYFFVEINVSR